MDFLSTVLAVLLGLFIFSIILWLLYLVFRRQIWAGITHAIEGALHTEVNRVVSTIRTRV